ncbi:hypothetical protein IWQ60_003883 [Tieghemiomyces parasiticus]|uniref:Phosphatidylinositol N-acetylglucosaminyltransferase subunit H conserved domain-containing protein n=1 Tax=Tieghemiomyces parasiticus TaxID=78921 RepID=A0A9W8AGR3_9FUNG|nr:hypothetical protein IWQ60_003883 [Tieghemiomyces parasiticus]
MESLLVIRDVGFQFTSVNVLGSRTIKFIDRADIRDIVVNEAISMLQVKTYLALLVRSENRMVVLFESPPPSPNLLPSTSSFTSCPVELQRLIMNAADLGSMPRFLEISRSIRAMAMSDRCIRSALARLRLSRATTYSTEFAELSEAEKDNVADIFRFEFDLFSNFIPGQIDLPMTLFRVIFLQRGIPQLLPLMDGFIQEAELLDAGVGVLDYSELSLAEKFSLSPMLSLASEGDVDVLLGLRDRLISYCESPEFLWALNRRRAPRMTALRDAAVEAYQIPNMYTCPIEGFMAADMAIVFAMVSARKFAELDTFLTTALNLDLPTPERPVMGDDGGDLNENQPAMGNLPHSPILQDWASLPSTSSISSLDIGAHTPSTAFSSVGTRTPNTEFSSAGTRTPNSGFSSEGARTPNTVFSDIDEDMEDREDLMDVENDGDPTSYLRRSTLAFMLMAELDQDPLVFPHFQDRRILGSLLWRVLVCASDNGFDKAHRKATTIWNEEVLLPIPELLPGGCNDRYFGQKIMYDHRTGSLKFLVNRGVLHDHDLASGVPFTTPEVLPSFHRHDTEQMRDILEVHAILTAHHSFPSMDDIDAEIERQVDEEFSDSSTDTNSGPSTPREW